MILPLTRTIPPMICRAASVREARPIFEIALARPWRLLEAEAVVMRVE
jgi:hypothetical protein